MGGVWGWWSVLHGGIFNSLAGHGAKHKARCWGRMAIALGRPTMVDGADSTSSGEEK